MSDLKNIRPSLVGEGRDVNDHKRLRHAREQHTGFQVGRYLQPPPMLFTRDGHNIFLGDVYRGRSAFLICGGPSLLSNDLEKLNSRGVLTCAVNNAGTLVRPHLWCSVDDPTHFHDVIWRDPAIMKFVPLCHMEKQFAIRNESGSLEASTQKVGDMPAVFGYRRNEEFRAEQWLYEDTFNWGNHSQKMDSQGNKGSRSVMYVALRLLFYLGIRRVYLLGCDFRMEYGQKNYAFEQDRSKASVSGNNSSYRILNTRFEQLKPYFQQEGFEVINCTNPSGLKVFPYLSYDEAIRQAVEDIPHQINTEGMYDNKQKLSNNGVTTDPFQPEKICPAGVPSTTVVLNLNSGDISKLKRTLPTWWERYPWLITTHFFVRASSDVLQQCRELKDLRTARFIQFCEAPPEDCLLNYLEDLSEQIRTPWALLIDPAAYALESTCRWPLSEWFQPQADSSIGPVMIGHRWGYARPSNLLEQFENWLISNGQSQNSKERISLISPKEGDRVNFPTIAEWFCWTNMEWLQSLLPIFKERLPDFSNQIHPVRFFHLCAMYQHQQVRRINMKEYGWGHHFN